MLDDPLIAFACGAISIGGVFGLEVPNVKMPEAMEDRVKTMVEPLTSQGKSTEPSLGTEAFIFVARLK